MKPEIARFSPHLFWDVNKEHLDIEESKRYIIQKTLQYGLYNDWLLIKKIYGLREIGEVAVGIRDLDKKTMNFISLICKIPKEKFACFITERLMPKHWNF